MPKIKVLVACDDMNTIQLISDILEINFRGVVIERALSLQSFWMKIAAPVPEGDLPYSIVFISLDYILDYIKDETPDSGGFVGRINPETLGKAIIMGDKANLESCGDDVKALPFLAKPFSLDGFQEIVKNFVG